MSQKAKRRPPDPNEKISDLFTDEEKEQLSYLGSMLHQEPTQEEQEQQRILDAIDSSEWAKLIGLKDAKPQRGDDQGDDPSGPGGKNAGHYKSLPFY